MTYPPYPGDSGEQVPSSAAPPPRQLEPAHGLMVGTIIVASVFTALEVLEAALSWPAQNRLLDAARSGESLAFTTPYDVVGLLWIPTLISAYVVTCLWLYRVRVNAEILSPSVHHARRRWWVWGSWIIPFVNLGFPYQVVRDISTNERAEVRAPRLNAWWTCWLLSFFIERFGLLAIDGQASADVDDAYSSLGFIESTNAAVCLVAFVLWIRIIRRINADQDRLLGIAR